MNELTEKTIAAAEKSFSEIIREGKSEKFYVFILYTDSDCSTILPSANSIEKYKEKLSKIPGEISPQTQAWYKWGSAEWAYEDFGGDQFEDICRILSDASLEASGNGGFFEFKKMVHSCMIDALDYLDKNNFFDKYREAAVIYISSSDGDEMLSIENESAKILNDKDKYESFSKRYQM